MASRVGVTRESRATLTFYPAAGRHPFHEHDHTQISFLLGGELRERLHGRDYRAVGVARGNKPAGILHNDEWGCQGALIFTVKIHDGPADQLGGRLEPGWAAVRHPQLIARLVHLFTTTGAASDRAEILEDLVGAEAELQPARREPPGWLKRARDSIAEVPEQVLIEEVARESGVHRVQLSRMFHRFYGIPPSIFRRRALVARALGPLIRSDAPVSAVAAAAGFFDQAHLTHSLRRDIGLSPRDLRSLFQTATSIQAPAPSRC